MELSATVGLPLDHCVTASQLVRNFGLWQDRATRHPVYVMHRGRPRLAIASIDLLEAMCGPRSQTAAAGADHLALIEGLDDMVLLLDRAGRLTASNQAARTFWRMGPVDIAVPVMEALPAPFGGFVAQVADRVGRSRTAERLEVGEAGGDVGRLSVTIFPLDDGVAIVARDLSTADAAQGAAATADALDAALAGIDGVARLRLNQRGYVAEPTASFVRMSGLSDATLRTVRFVSVIEIASRVTVAEAIERVLATRRQETVRARLLRNTGEALPVAIGIAPVVRNLAVTSVEAVLVAGG